MKVALVKPSPQIVHERPEYPCIGIAYLSAFLKANGVEILAIDASFDGTSPSKMDASIVRFEPQILGFTAMTHEIVNVAKTAKRLKESLPDSLVVIGGPHATVAPLRTLKEFSVFDIAIIGEGELTFNEIIQTIESDFGKVSLKSNGEVHARLTDKLKAIQGIAFRLENDVKINPRRELIQDLDSLPFPSYDHLNRKVETYPIFSSRGCPNCCIFCCRIMGNRIRVRSPKNVVDEVKYAVEKFGSKRIDFADETFTFPKERAQAICDLMIKEGLNKRIKWVAQSRVTGVSRELFDKMKEAGCVRVGFGVESGNAEMLRIMKKGITLDDASRTINHAKKSGLKTVSFFIIGHPYETTQTISDTIEFATKLNTSLVSFGIMVPYPGTEIYEMARHCEGKYRLISEDWQDYDKQLGNALELENLNRKQLEKWQRKAYLTFYLKNLRLPEMMRQIYAQRKLVWQLLTK